MLSFRVIIIISIELLQPSIHAVVMYIFLMLKLAIIHFLSVCFRIPASVKKNYLLQQLYFQSSII